jgi:hypothetical protein
LSNLKTFRRNLKFENFENSVAVTETTAASALATRRTSVTFATLGVRIAFPDLCYSQGAFLVLTDQLKFIIYYYINLGLGLECTDMVFCIKKSKSREFSINLTFYKFIRIIFPSCSSSPYYANNVTKNTQKTSKIFIIYKFLDEMLSLIERWKSRQGQQKPAQILNEVIVVKICQLEWGRVSDFDDCSCLP